MKAGVAIALTALEILAEANLLRGEIVLLLNGDEEIGSPASRPIIERIAHECDAVYVLEPAKGLAYKTARKGIGNWKIAVTGVAAHAGADFEKGASAIRELARAIEAVSGWTDLKRGLTASVGKIGGGTKSNVIPAEAWAVVDVRIPRAADGPRIARKFAALRATNPRCTLTVTGGMNRPPMERSRGTVRLYHRARELALELGFALDEAATGGASDGNFTAALGIPTHLPLTGYVVSTHWARENQAALDGFIAAARAANAILAASDAEWEKIAPLTGATDSAELTKLRDAYRDGIPRGWDEADRAAAARLHRLLAEIGGTALVGPSPDLTPGTFLDGMRY